MHLILLRHGPAEPRSADVCDADRRLTKDGRRKMNKSLGGLCRILDLKPANQEISIWHSPLLRSSETARILAEMLNLPTSCKDFIAVGDLQLLLEAVTQHHDRQTLIITGHEPYLSQWSDALVNLELPFKKGAAAAMKIDQARPGSGELLWFLQPAALRSLGR